MRIKYSCIYWVFILLLAFQSAYGQNEITDKTTQNISVQQFDWRIDNLVKQAKELFEAYDKEDFEKFLQLTHPKVYEDGLYEKDGLKGLFNEFWDVIEVRKIGFDLLPSSIESPGELFEINKQLFVVFPYKLNSIRRSNKDKVVSLGSMVGISEDGGKSWKFAKGAAFNLAFPDVAGMLVIPNPYEKLVNGIEQ